jgi:hypothetical protein
MPMVAARRTLDLRLTNGHLAIESTTPKVKETFMETLTIVADELDEPAAEQLRSLLSEEALIERLEGPDTTDQSRIDPVTVTVVAIGIIVGTGVLTKVADWWQARSDCLLVIDARTDDLLIQPRCDLAGYKGMTIIVADSATQVTVRRQEGAVSVDDVIKAVRAGIPAVNELAAIHGSDAISIEPLQSQLLN